MDKTKSFEYSNGIMVSFLPHTTKVGIEILANFSIMVGACLKHSIVDMKTIFAFGCSILSMKCSMVWGSILSEPDIISYAVLTVFLVGYNAAIVYASSVGFETFMVPLGETSTIFSNDLL